jgi:hypothetical protein
LRQELVERDEVRVNQIRQGPKLPFESIQRVRAGIPQDLQGDRQLSLAVIRFVDDAGRTRPNPLFDDEPIAAAKLLEEPVHTATLRNATMTVKPILSSARPCR